MSGTNPITVLVIDDHPVVREGLRAIISSEPDLAVVADVGTGAEAIDAYFIWKPAITLVDLLLPDISGSEVIRQICQRAPGARLIVLTTVAGDEEIYRALDAGARGYLLKDMVRKELIQAIREVAGGRRYIPAKVGSSIAENFPRVELSGREIEVLRLLATGYRIKEIGPHLGISEATVNTHIKHILEKLNAHDRTHAVTIALRRGIIHL